MESILTVSLIAVGWAEACPVDGFQRGAENALEVKSINGHSP